jgi:uncharacterized protein YjbI with pentapeptide repeats/DNA-binding Xre family transcriptional regulator
MARTLIATEMGAKRAKEALIDLGITQTVLAEKRLKYSRSTVSNFFNRKPIAHENFTEICKILKLEWRDIAEINEDVITGSNSEENITLVKKGVTSPELQHPVYEANQTDNEELATFTTETITAASSERIEKQIRLAFAIAGTVDQVDQKKLTAIVKLLRQVTGDSSISIIDIQEGSIKLILEATPEALAKIQTLYRSGKLTEVEGASIVNVGFENLKGASLREVNFKEANLQGVDLRGATLIEATFLKANLSGADLRGTDFSGAELCRANLSRANLCGAELCRANLSGANLSGADLSGANLSEANFSRANLSRIELCGANIELARFGFNKGISEEMKRDLISRGAIFEDLQGGDNSRMLFPLSR